MVLGQAWDEHRVLVTHPLVDAHGTPATLYHDHGLTIPPTYGKSQFTSSTGAGVAAASTPPSPHLHPDNTTPLLGPSLHNKCIATFSRNIQSSITIENQLGSFWIPLLSGHNLEILYSKIVNVLSYYDFYFTHIFSDWSFQNSVKHDLKYL